MFPDALSRAIFPLAALKTLSDTMLSDFRGKKGLEQLGPPVDKAPFFVIPAKAGNQEELAVNDHLTGKNSTVPLHIVFLKVLSFVCFLLQEGLS